MNNSPYGFSLEVYQSAFQYVATRDGITIAPAAAGILGVPARHCVNTGLFSSIGYPPAVAGGFA
jgi:hypothetical protein